MRRSLARAFPRRWTGPPLAVLASVAGSGALSRMAATKRILAAKRASGLELDLKSQRPIQSEVSKTNQGQGPLMQLQPPPKTVRYHLSIDSGAEIMFNTAVNAAARAAKAISQDSSVVVRFQDAKNEDMVLTRFLERVNRNLIDGGDPRRVSASAMHRVDGMAYALHVLAVDKWLDESPEPKAQTLEIVLHVQLIAPLFYFFCSTATGAGPLGAPVPAGTREQAIQKLELAGFSLPRASQLVHAAESSQSSNTGPVRITRSQLGALGISPPR